MAFVRLGDLARLGVSEGMLVIPVAATPEGSILYSDGTVRHTRFVPPALPPKQVIPTPQPALTTAQQVNAIADQIAPIAQAAVTTHYSQASDTEGEGNLAVAPAASPATGAVAAAAPAASSGGTILALGAIGAILSGLFGGKH